ncbi:MAG: nickel pincer cofactor biosynthesis protein LarB [Candidatus Thermoplasmatota archaeon]|nr:nickel pincer cofactor biosynthesis protein LarB [Candidatus Thermoplasmatota archaeon]
MDMDDLDKLLEKYKASELSKEELKKVILDLPYTDFGDTKVDTFRELRKGLPEAVFCPGKSEEQLKNIASEGDRFFTRASEDDYEIVKSVREDAEYHEKARIIVVGDVTQTVKGKVVVVTGGSTDVPVAEEAAIPLEEMGFEVERLYDVGVAGIHRLLPHVEVLRETDAVIVAAGMDGTLPGIVAGLIGTPVIGIPTSVGYGVAREGRSALETMLNSCATGLAVVNIDNGYGAAAFVHHMLKD